MMTPAQARAARAFLNWSQHEVARRSGLGRNTVAQFENARHPTRPATIIALQKAFTDAGVRFDTDAEGRAWVGGHPNP